MGYVIVYSDKAISDLDDIYEYISSETASESIAQEYVARVLHIIENLEIMPEMGTQLKQVTPIAGGYRFLVAESHLAFYRLEEKTVYIDRILHKRQEYIRILFE